MRCASSSMQMCSPLPDLPRAGPGPEDPAMEGPVEPATGEDAEQCRNHDGPAQCSDHGEVLAQRPFALALPALAAFLPSSDRLSQPLVIFGRSEERRVGKECRS